MTHSCSGAALTVVLVLSVVACGGVPSAIAREDMPCVEARQAGAGDAESVCQRVYEAARREGRGEDAQRALFQLAIIARTEGQFGRAEELYAEIQRQPAFAGDWKAQYRLARERGIVAHLKGDAASALTFFRGALALASEHGDQSLVGRSHNDLGNAYRHIGAQREALDAFVRSLEIKRRRGDPQIGSTLNNIANLLTDLGEYERARRYYDQALAHHLENDDEHHIAHTQEDRAHLAALQRRDDEAIELFREAFDHFGRLQAVPDQIRVATLRAALAVEEGEAGVAERWLQQALVLSETVDGELLSPRWYNVKADVLALEGRTEAALAMLQGVEAASARWPDEQRIGMLARLAEFSQTAGRLEQALDYRRLFHEESVAQARRHHDHELTQSRVLFEVAEQQRAIESLRAENDIQRLTIREQRVRTAFVGLCGVVGIGMVVLGAVGFQRRRNRIERTRRRVLERALNGYRESAKALRTSQARLQRLLDFSGDALLALDANDRVVFANDAACRLLNLKTAPRGQPVDELFESGTRARLEREKRDLMAATRNGSRLRASIETLSLEEELQVLTLRPPEQPEHAAEGLIPMINRHFSRVQSFSAVLQASLKKGRMPDELQGRWRIIDREIQSLAEQLHPVHDDLRRNFREQLVGLMGACLEVWERTTGGTRVDLAESSGIWRVTIDEGRLRTRAMDRYLNIGRLPGQPRWREVVRTAYFVLGECPPSERAKLRRRVESVLELARELGLA